MHDHVCSLSLYWDSPSVFARLEKWRRKTETSGDSLVPGTSGADHPIGDLGRSSAEERTEAAIATEGETPC